MRPINADETGARSRGEMAGAGVVGHDRVRKLEKCAIGAKIDIRQANGRWSQCGCGNLLAGTGTENDCQPSGMKCSREFPEAWPDLLVFAIVRT
jgi:hypothetical protein